MTGPSPTVNQPWPRTGFATEREPIPTDRCCGDALVALVVAIAEPGGTVLTGDRVDIEAFAVHANAVAVEVV